MPVGRPFIQQQRFHKNRQGLQKGEHGKTNSVLFSPSTSERQIKETSETIPPVPYVRFKKAHMQLVLDGEPIPGLSAVVAKVLEEEAKSKVR